ncbi:DUF4384 domain-containing protein [Thalassococcus lentus]|uniref:DUF4384 domain-containing protein n=1 Tax=Thalassococcus lentus TaxID=1210524 RepID=A0ABT4XXM6_9RHOB|nr:DUF4384 domain-containing protein [Thalassococcus lentus]MDA7426728.1 DUF4384 domain-containing protein [Thalassococcus lentus]
MTPITMIRASALAMAAFFAAPAYANDAMPLPDDATEMETAAYAVLDKHCARCHQDGALKEGMTKAKSGFGHVLDIRRLAQDPKFVLQGKADSSKLHAVMLPSAAPPMPDDCSYDNLDCFPTKAEIDTIEQWIVSLAETAPPAREFVPMEELFALAHADLQAQPTNRQDRIRYLSMREVHNDPDVSAENVEGYRQATVKLMNALSWNPTPYKFEPVDEHGVLFRVFLPDLDWDHDTWSHLEKLYPYGMSSNTDKHLSQLQYLSGATIPVIRADWFAATASVSPLYYDMLGLPDTVQGLEQMLNLDMVRNIRDEQVIRAGFQDSGVSTHNRLIERHAMGTGFFWTSYDFAGSKGRQSFFEYPLGPKEAYGEELAFEHDGGESIFTLPNGFHAYYLNTADGARLDVGPTQIVRDDDYTDGTGEVVNGISCISCHSKGIRFNEDKVRDVAMNNFSLSPEVRQTIDAIYPGQETVNAIMQADTDQFANAMRGAGLNPEITAGGLEPVRGLFVYHVDQFVDFSQAANELGMTDDELRGRMPFVGHELAGLMTRLDQSPIARDEWAVAYPQLLAKVTEYKPILTDHPVPATLSYSVQQATGVKPKPVKVVVDKAADPYAQAVQKQKQADYVPAQHSAPTQSHLTVYTNQPVYKVGEGVKIIVEPRHECRLTLINIDDQHRSCVLYPHPDLPDAAIPAGGQFVFPPGNATLTAAEAGKETILAICNSSKEAIAHERKGTSEFSCAVGQDTYFQDDKAYNALSHELLALDTKKDDKKSGSGVDYRAISTHNPHVAKAQITAIVKDY